MFHYDFSFNIKSGQFKKSHCHAAQGKKGEREEIDNRPRILQAEFQDLEYPAREEEREKQNELWYVHILEKYIYAVHYRL